MNVNLRGKHRATVLLATLAVAASVPVAPALAQTAAPAASPAAAQLTLTAIHRRGTTSVELNGTAPAGTSLTVAITGRIARDLPVVLIARTVVVAASDGTYAVRVPIGSVSFPDTALRATVRGPRLPPVAAALRLTDPDPSFNSPNNTLPPDK